MGSTRTPPEGHAARLRVLYAARHELAAAGALLANLGHGGRPAAIHLVRAAQALSRIGPSVGPEAGGPAPEAGLGLEGFEPPGLTDRQRLRYREAFPVIEACAGPPLELRPGLPADLERRARVVHDSLGRSLLAMERDPRLRPGRWPAALLSTGVTVVVCAVAAVNAPPRARPSVVPATAPAPRAQVRSQVRRSELATPKAQGTPWDAPGNIIIPADPGYLIVELDELSHAPVVELSVDNNDRYRVEFLRGTEVAGETTVGPSPTAGGMVTYRLEVPTGAVETGYDSLRIGVVEGDASWSVGHVLLLPREPGP